MKNHKVYIGVGSNIEPEININRSKKQLLQYFDCKFSKTYKYAAIGFKGAEFLNLVAKFYTDLDLQKVQEILARIEKDIGRKENQRGLSNRVIDLDILMFGDLIKQGKKPLPHRNLEDCIFVLEPLVELSPKEVHPVQKKTFKEILDNIDQ